MVREKHFLRRGIAMSYIAGAPTTIKIDFRQVKKDDIIGL